MRAPGPCMYSVEKSSARVSGKLEVLAAAAVGLGIANARWARGATVSRHDWSRETGLKPLVSDG